MQKAIKLSISLNVDNNVIDVEAFVKIKNLISHRIEHGDRFCSKQISVLVASDERLERCVAAIELGSELRVRFNDSSIGPNNQVDDSWFNSVLTSATEFGQHFIFQIDLLEGRSGFISSFFGGRPGFINRLFGQREKV